MAQSITPYEVLANGDSAARGSKWQDAVVLGTAASAETYTVPAGARRIKLMATANFWARYEGTPAAKPTTEITDGSGSEMNPYELIVNPGNTISFVSDTAGCVITVSVYST